VDHVVKRAPKLAEQVRDTTRTNKITYIKDQTHAIHTSTSDSYYKSNRESVSEQEALQQLDTFLATATELKKTVSNNRYGLSAESMRDNLAFIGEKEYKEAAEGIANYWKTLLNTSERQQICVIVGDIAKSGYRGQTKSDEYLLDNILAHFSDKELEAYGARLTVDEEKLGSRPEDTKVVLLDDWTISGSQLGGVATRFIARHPELEGQIEVQMIAASAARIKKGTLDAPGTYYGGGTSKTSMIPIRAYFMAHNAAEGIDTSSGTHITGSHSSVDYDFENDIAHLADAMRYEGLGDGTLPPPTNIVRPYRDARLHNIERLEKSGRTWIKLQKTKSVV
jgi:hypothetical protein